MNLFESSPSLIAPQEVQPKYTQSALSGCNKKEGDILHQAQSSI